MRILICLLVAFMIGCSSSKKPQPVRPDLPDTVEYGFDWLAAQHPNFNLGAALEELPPGKYPIGILDGSFGESLEPVRLILGSGKVNHFIVHLTNGAGLRNGQLAPYEIGHGHNISSFSQAVVNGDQSIMQPFIQRVMLYCGLMEEFPSVRFYLSPQLEHNLTVQAYNTLAGAMWGHCTRNDYYTVNNPVGSHPFPANPMPDGERWIAYEDHHHSFDSRANLNSLDGEDIDHINVAQWKQNVANSNVRIARGWAWKWNCRVPGPFIDPRSRTNCPTRDEHRHIIHRTLSGATPPPQPAPSGSISESWGSGSLWKPVSESDGNLVVLIKNHYREEFDSCRVPLKSGGWETLRFAGRTNPDRLTYRANRRCGQYKERRVVCNRGDFELTISGGSNACQRGG